MDYELLNSFETLVTHLRSNKEEDWTQVDVDLIQDIYEIIPDELKHEGIIYRGFSIEEKNIIDLFTDNEFYSDKRNEIDSWSVSGNTANKFANGNIYFEKPIGVVVKDIIQKNDDAIVMDLSEDVLSWLNKEMLSFVREENNNNSLTLDDINTDSYLSGDWTYVMKYINLYAHEEEILIRGLDRGYRLCDDVIRVTINTKDVREHIHEMSTSEGNVFIDLVYGGLPKEEREWVYKSNDILFLDCNNGVLDWSSRTVLEGIG